jgi:hypothetical protein
METPGRAAPVSGPKSKCPSCGSEWDSPVIFCGECGTPISQGERVSTSGDRVARLPPPTPPPPPSPTASAALPVGRIEKKTSLGLSLKPAVTMPSVVAPPGEAPDRDAKPSRGAGRRKKSLPAIHVEPSGQEETQRILEDLDAGFDSIVRPSELPVPPGSSPGNARLTVPMGIELFEPTPSVRGATPPDVEPPPAADLAPAPAVEPAPAAEPVITPDPVPVISPEAEAEAAAARAAQHEADMVPVRALFADMAIDYARPLRDFMIEVAWGEPSKEWLEIATPAVAALRRGSAEVEMPELTGALDGVAAALELAAGETSIDREVKELVTGAYAKLVEVLPAAFALDGERGQRESIIVRSLLRQVPGVHKVALDRISAAGLSSLSMFYAARARDLSEATGLDPDVAADIVEKFQAHRRAMAGLAPGKDRANERAELASLVAELERVHEAHERAAKAWSAGAAARKATLRREREDVMLQIDVALAHLGEVRRQRDLAKLPFHQKIRELSRYLEEARQ